MTDPHAARPWLDPPRLSQSSAAMAAGAYGLRWRWALAAISRGVRRLEVPACRAGAEPEARRRAALWASRSGRRISTCTSPARINNLGSQGVHVRQSDPARPARQRQDDHPGSRAQLGDRQGRQDLHVFPAQGRAVPRRRRADRRRRQGHLRPHRQAAARHQHPAQHPVQGGQRDQRAATNTRSSSSCPRRARPTSSCRRSPAAGT